MEHQPASPVREWPELLQVINCLPTTDLHWYVVHRLCLRHAQLSSDKLTGDGPLAMSRVVCKYIAFALVYFVVQTESVTPPAQVDALIAFYNAAVA